MRSDDALIPPTLSDLAHDVSGVVCWCNRCHHSGVLPIGELLSRLGPSLPFPMVHGRLRCQACGSTDIHARPDWPKIGQATRHTDWPRQEKAPDEAGASSYLGIT